MVGSLSYSALPWRLSTSVFDYTACIEAMKPLTPPGRLSIRLRLKRVASIDAFVIIRPFLCAPRGVWPEVSRKLRVKDSLLEALQ